MRRNVIDKFQEPNDATLFDPLQFLHDTNSSFFINLYPYNLYHLNPKIPLGISLFQKHLFNFCNNFTFDVRYRNLFDVMCRISSILQFGLIQWSSTPGPVKVRGLIRHQNGSGLKPKPGSKVVGA
ncbi:hypothetical protein JHK85_023232 [Glycine max]|nr:hypothetical protein JHK85_023232 [Glycine max]KAG5026850.1 hypothetical protein JHK86_022764 [Glycine max]